jgi:hypothetical protein
VSLRAAVLGSACSSASACGWTASRTPGTGLLSAQYRPSGAAPQGAQGTGPCRRKAEAERERERERADRAVEGVSQQLSAWRLSEINALSNASYDTSRSASLITIGPNVRIGAQPRLHSARSASPGSKNPPTHTHHHDCPAPASLFCFAGRFTIFEFSAPPACCCVLPCRGCAHTQWLPI